MSQVFGGLGEWLATLALIALVWEKTHSAVASGLILAFRILPGAVIGSIVGALVDRFDRRRVLIACTAGRAAIYGTLPLVGGLAPVLALAFVAEIGTIAYVVARDATLPHLVPSHSLPAANALSMGSSFAAMPVGSGIFAGLVWIQAAIWRPGFSLALVVAGGMLGVATLLLGRVRAHVLEVEEAPAPVRATRSERRTDRRAGRAALREIFAADPILKRLALGAGIAAAGGGAVLTLGLSYVRETLDASAGAYGLLLTTFCIGAAVGAAAVQLSRSNLPRIFNAGIGTMGAILLTMGLFPSAAIGYGMAFAFGGAFIATFLGGITVLQDRVHESVRGRAFAVAHSGLRLGAVVVGVLSAWGAKAIGASPQQVAGLSLDGTQVVFALAGLLLFTAGALLLRPARAVARA